MSARRAIATLVGAALVAVAGSAPARAHGGVPFSEQILCTETVGPVDTVASRGAGSSRAPAGAADTLAGCALGLVAASQLARRRRASASGRQEVAHARGLAGLLLAVSCAAVGAAGCSVVRPYQREALARPGMSLDPDPESDAEQHVFESREGASGGAGSVGGGCGCN